MAGRRAVGLRGGEAGGQKLVIALEVDGAGSVWWDTASNCINREVRETSCGPLIATQTNAVLAEQRAALWRATRKPSPLPRASGAAAGRWRHGSSRRPRAPALQPPGKPCEYVKAGNNDLGWALTPGACQLSCGWDKARDSSKKSPSCLSFAHGDYWRYPGCKQRR